MFNLQTIQSLNWSSFSVRSVKDALSNRRTKKLLEQAELEESLKRESFLVTSVNLQQKNSNATRNKLEQSWPATRKMDIYVPPPRGDPRDPMGLGGFSVNPDDSGSEMTLSMIGEGDVTDRHTTICTVFWKLSLTMNQFVCGDRPVDFGSLWPDREDLQVVLLEAAYNNTPIHSCVPDLTRIALLCGPLRLLKTLIDLNLVKVSERLENGNSLLHTACIARNFDAALYLCSLGINTKLKNPQGKTARNVCFCPRILQVLPSSSSSPSASAIVHRAGVSSSGQADGQWRSVHKHAVTLHDTEVLFDMAANVNEVDDLLIKLQTFDFDVNTSHNYCGEALVHVASRQGVCQLPLLLCLQHSYLADIDVQNRAGLTCLMMAAKEGQPLMVDALLCILGADPDVINKENGWSALHYACVNNHVDVVSILLKRCVDFNKEDASGCRPDDLALRNGAADCQQIITAHRKKRVEELTQMIQQGTLRSRDVYDSDLYVTNDHGNTLIMEAAEKNRVNCMLPLLTSRHAPINAQHEKSLQTALMLAAREGYKHVIRVLLKYGACAKIRDIEGFIALHHAVRNNHPEAVETLLAHTEALTGLYKALHLSHCKQVRHLLKAAINRRQRELVVPVLFESAMTGDAGRLFCLLEEGDNVNPTSGVGEWPLYMAVENGHLETVKLLCDSGGDFSRRHPSTGNTVLHVTCARGHYNVADYLIQRFARYDRAKFVGNSNNHNSSNGSGSSSSSSLSLSDSMLNLENSEGKVPLILAAERGYSRIVQLLLKHGASTSILDPATGDLYQCTDYQGCQVLIETHRKEHLLALTSAIAERWGFGMRRFKGAFRPRYDHNLRDRHGDTLLMNACRLQKASFIQYILASAVYNVHQTRREYIRRSESTDSGTFFDVTPPTSATQNSGGRHDLTHDLQEEAAAQPITDRLTNGGGAEGGHFENAGENGEKTEKAPVKFTIGGEVESAHEATETESAIQSKGSKSKSAGKVLSPAAKTMTRKESSLPIIDDPEVTLKENISTLFDSISCMSRGNIYITENTVSHLCATNPRDGATCFHRAVEGGDNVAIFRAILEADSSGVNIQDNAGLSALHLACKLRRKKTIQLLTTFPNVDLNVRTLDGQLPEEMCQDKGIIRMVRQARTQEPEQMTRSRSGLMSFTETFLGDHDESPDGTSIDFEKINTRFVMMKQQMGVTDFYGDYGS